jgi:outer membrane protein
VKAAADGNSPWAAHSDNALSPMFNMSTLSRILGIEKKGGNMLARRIALFIVMGIALSAFASTSGYCADVAKIGTVSFEKIFNSSAGGKAVKNQINEEGRGMEADLEKLQKEIKDLQDLLNKDNSAGVMDESARENKAWELDRKIDEVKALKKRYSRKIQELQARLINGVRKDVLAVITEYAKKEGYLLVVEDLNVLYAPQSLDITDKIIQLYDAKYAKKSK